MRKYTIRTCIIAVWILLIAAILYWPKWGGSESDPDALNIFAWGDILEPSIVAQFEQESGIKVNLNYYSSNEELIVKLKATKGVGYDLIVPSDYAVQELIEGDLLQKIDKEKLDFWKQINPALLGHFFDPDNTYSIPYEWELFGFGIDAEYFQNRSYDPSWKMLFEPKADGYKVTMSNDPIEAVEFAAFYLFGEVEHLTPAQTQLVRTLLVNQKKSVAAYASFRGDYFLATRNCAVVLASSSYIWKTMRLFDFVRFVVPKEGTFITIENLCIPKASSKQQAVYRFINYIYQPHSVRTHFEEYGFFPATVKGLETLELDPQAKQLLGSTKEDFKKYHFLKNTLPLEEVREIWVEVKTGG